jgi:hypothetical protein
MRTKLLPILLITLAATLSGCVVVPAAQPVWVPECSVFVGGVWVVHPGYWSYHGGGWGWGHGWRR